MEFVAFKSKKSGRYFKFAQYCDDGYGKYEDSVNPEMGEVPELLRKKDWDYRVAYNKKEHPEISEAEMVKVMIIEFKDHKPADVEVVPVTVTYGG